MEPEAIHEIRINFRERVWLPYLRAREGQIRALRRGVAFPDGSRRKIKIIFLRDGRLMYHDGKQEKQIYPKPEEKSLTQRGKYSRNT